MKIEELRKMDNKKLTELLVKLDQTLVRLRSELALGKLKNSRQIRQTRHEIARLETVLQEKSLIESSNA